MHTQTRSSSAGINAAPPDSIPCDSTHDRTPGARRPGARPSTPGGGYLNICTAFEAAVGSAARAPADPRIDELRRMSLPRVWLRVAEAIGYETFMDLWRVLCSDESVQNDRQRVRVPLFSKYTRYQRNQVIRRLHEEGQTPNAIRRYIARATGERLCKSTVLTVLRIKGE
jgi:hypothetical protein